jgi:hypothetical protein
MEAMNMTRESEVGLEVWELGVILRRLGSAETEMLQGELASLLQHRETLIDLVDRLKQERAA